MSPERAKVFVAEDADLWQRMIKRILANDGHQIVSSATNLKDALAAIDRFAELGVQVAIIDGNLDEDESTGCDGQAVLAAIHRVVPQVKTIGFSRDRVCGVDVDLGKEKSIDLGKTVTKI